jgi:hypothetical protein
MHAYTASREAIKQQIRFTKQESLSTTRNAIRTAREAEETATSTLSKLGQQTGAFTSTEKIVWMVQCYRVTLV